VKIGKSWTALAVGLSVCALIPSPSTAHASAAAAPDAAPASTGELPPPLQTERFVLKPGQTVIGKAQMVRLKPHQVLSDIARLFDVGNDAIERANPNVDPWLAPVGTRVIVPTEFVLPDAPHVGIVVNLAAMRLFYFPPHAPGKPQVVITHPVGIGRLGWPTPTGMTRVVWHEAHPVWEVPRSILAEHAKEGEPLPKIVGAGPTNPLGNFALHLGWPGYLIHGTDKPAGVGRRVSHGCVHLYPEDIRQIFAMVPNGTPVRIVNQPYLFGWRHGHLYMQAYAPLKDDKRPWATESVNLLGKVLTHNLIQDLSKAHQRIRWSHVSALLADPRVVPLPVSGNHLGGEELSAMLVQNRLPAGSAWNGKTHLPLTSAELRKIMAQYASGKPASSGHPQRAASTHPSAARATVKST
jgi:L,D-transpeptidase ErfK/SrfK